MFETILGPYISVRGLRAESQAEASGLGIGAESITTTIMEAPYSSYST